MTVDTHLVTDLSSLRLRTPGPAIAGVWLTFGESSFPSQGWSDFIVVILGWWADAIVQVIHDKNLHAKVSFMDGPFLVEVYRAEADRLSFEMFEDSAGGQLFGVGGAPLRQFAIEVTDQSRLVLEACEAKEWWSSDAAILAGRVADLCRELDSLHRVG